VLFTAPQYFQAVRGTDAMGSGLRLLPLIGGLLVGAGVASQLAKGVGASITVALGFVVMAAGLFLGATTRLESSDAFALAWIALVGTGLGFVLPAAMSAALGTLSAERSGVGSALIQAARQVGGTIGVALLGSVMQAVYRDHVDVTGLQAPLAAAVQRGVGAGVGVAHQLSSAPLLASVQGAFVAGMGSMLQLCGGIAVAGAVLALLFLPRRAAAVPVAHVA